VESVHICLRFRLEGNGILNPGSAPSRSRKSRLRHCSIQQNPFPPRSACSPPSSENLGRKPSTFRSLRR
jgi:hypothetical protein